MGKKRVVASIVLMTLVAIAACAGAAEKTAVVKEEGSVEKLAPQQSCPVLSGKLNKEIYADYEGKRVYFCCQQCKDSFAQDPVKYLNVLADRGEEAEAIPQEESQSAPQETSPGHSHSGSAGATCPM